MNTVCWLFFSSVAVIVVSKAYCLNCCRSTPSLDDVLALINCVVKPSLL